MSPVAEADFSPATSPVTPKRRKEKKSKKSKKKKKSSKRDDDDGVEISNNGHADYGVVAEDTASLTKRRRRRSQSPAFEENDQQEVEEEEENTGISEGDAAMVPTTTKSPRPAEDDRVVPSSPPVIMSRQAPEQPPSSEPPQSIPRSVPQQQQQPIRRNIMDIAQRITPPQQVYAQTPVSSSGVDGGGHGGVVGATIPSDIPVMRLDAPGAGGNMSSSNTNVRPQQQHQQQPQVFLQWNSMMSLSSHSFNGSITTMSTTGVEAAAATIMSKESRKNQHGFTLEEVEQYLNARDDLLQLHHPSQVVVPAATSTNNTCAVTEGVSNIQAQELPSSTDDNACAAFVDVGRSSSPPTPPTAAPTSAATSTTEDVASVITPVSHNDVTTVSASQEDSRRSRSTLQGFVIHEERTTTNFTRLNSIGGNSGASGSGTGTTVGGNWSSAISTLSYPAMGGGGGGHHSITNASSSSHHRRLGATSSITTSNSLSSSVFTNGTIDRIVRTVMSCGMPEPVARDIANASINKGTIDTSVYHNQSSIEIMKCYLMSKGVYETDAAQMAKDYFAQVQPSSSAAAPAFPPPPSMGGSSSTLSFGTIGPIGTEEEEKIDTTNTTTSSTDASQGTGQLVVSGSTLVHQDVAGGVDVPDPHYAHDTEPSTEEPEEDDEEHQDSSQYSYQLVVPSAIPRTPDGSVANELLDVMTRISQLSSDHPMLHHPSTTSTTRGGGGGGGVGREIMVAATQTTVAAASSFVPPPLEARTLEVVGVDDGDDAAYFHHHQSTSGKMNPYVGDEEVGYCIGIIASSDDGMMDPSHQNAPSNHGEDQQHDPHHYHQHHYKDFSFGDQVMFQLAQRRFAVLVFTFFTLLAVGLGVGLGLRDGMGNVSYARNTTIDGIDPDAVNGNSSTTATAVPTMAPTVIKDHIQLLALKISSSAAVMAEGTPQRRAIGWMSTFDTIAAEQYYQSDSNYYSDDEDLLANFAQRYALVVLYFSTNGEEWTNQDQWLDPTLHECEWSSAHILCRRRSVVGLGLSFNGLAGTIPFELQYLNLEVLRLGRNSIGGVIPEGLCSHGQWNGLTELKLDDNKLNGPIPDDIGACSSLQKLNFNYNKISGTIPQSLRSLTSLTRLMLSHNELRGPLLHAEDFDFMRALVAMDFRHNQLTGTVPDFGGATSMTNLAMIHFDWNFLTGPVPSNLAQREEVTMSYNLLSGNVNLTMMPSSFTSPPSPLSVVTTTGEENNDNIMRHDEKQPITVTKNRLEVLDLAYNLLTGTLPNAPLPQLRHVDLSDNTFRGSIQAMLSPTKNDNGDDSSSSLLLFPRFEYLDVANNAIGGTLQQDDLIRLEGSIQHLDLSKNPMMEGRNLELSISRFERLESMILSGISLLGSTLTNAASNGGTTQPLKILKLNGCGLVGSIPADTMGQLTNLQVLDMQDNQLDGTIPPSIGNLTFLRELRLGNNALTGTIPNPVADLQLLQILGLDGNVLSGSVPDAINVIPHLDILLLNGTTNTLSGSLSDDLCTNTEVHAAQAGCLLSGSCVPPPLSDCSRP